MAKVSFTKLNKIKNIEPAVCIINGEEISVLQYLPIEDKIDLIARVVEQAGEQEEGFYNIIKLEVFYIIEMVKAYTNINFTEKQLENASKLYDILILNNIWEEISKTIPESECQYVWESVLSIAREVTDYNHSVLGILKAMKTDYSDLELDATKIEDTLANDKSLTLLKDILEKLG